jgi:hypothetical protein
VNSKSIYVSAAGRFFASRKLIIIRAVFVKIPACSFINWMECEDMFSALPGVRKIVESICSDEMTRKRAAIAVKATENRQSQQTYGFKIHSAPVHVFVQPGNERVLVVCVASEVNPVMERIQHFVSPQAFQG